MKWMLEPIKKYATFSGRARRKEFWLYTLGLYIVSAILSAILIPGMDPQNPAITPGIIIYALFGLATILPTLAVTIRRLHDSGKSGWLYLLCLTGIGGIVIFIFTLMDSTKGTNQYGPNPKGE